ncbi:leucine-rich repeat domain-containing protein [bacterium]|nr:leucine-rich repeat domain-containing protein [bacterium]
MIKYLVNKHGESVLVTIYKNIQNEDHPVNAIINSCPDPEKWWPDFLKEYTLGNIYNDVKPEFFNYHLSDTFEIKSESDTSKTFSGEYGDLSGKVYLIDLATHRKVDPEASIQIDVSSEDSEGVQVSVFKWCPGKIGYLEGPADSLAIPNVKVLADQWWDLLVLVTNSRNVWEYDDLSEIDLEIEVGVEGAEVNFPDPCLRKAINRDILRAEDDTNPIEKSELEEKVFSLVWQNWDGSKCSINSLSGIEYCVNLVALYLHDNQITDISALSGLTNLERLDLSDNQIADISALPAPTGGFATFFLENNQITDISPLVANPGLRRGSQVNLRGNPLDHNCNPDNGPTEDYDNVRALRERGVMVNW